MLLPLQPRNAFEDNVKTELPAEIAAVSIDSSETEAVSVSVVPWEMSNENAEDGHSKEAFDLENQLLAAAEENLSRSPSTGSGFDTIANFDTEFPEDQLEDQVETCVLELLNTDGSCPDERRSSAAHQLKVIARTPEGRQIIYNSRVVPKIVNLLADPDTLDDVAALLVNLAWYGDVVALDLRTELLEASAIPKLFWALEYSRISGRRSCIRQ